MKISKIIFAILVLAYITGCKPEKFTTNGADRLSFSFDTIMFDTIISQLYVGTPKSVNRQFVVINKHDKKIKTSIHLAGGDKSTFRLNVDGQQGIQFDDIEIRAHDSIFVFVEAYANQNHNPNGDAIILRDSIVFLTNGNYQNVQIVAWGQDAIYYFKDSTETDMVWDNKTKPYVVYGFFRIKPGATLTIKEGVKIYFSPYSPLEIYGTLKIEGTASEPVIMEGDRTSDKNSDRHYPIKYANVPGQWFGLAFGWPTKGNVIKHARIKNGIYGIFVDSSSSDGQPTVSIENTFIQNMTASAVLGRRANVNIKNSVLVNCGSYCLLTYKGGDYDLRHVTISGYCDFGGGNEPALWVTNRLRNSFGQVIETYPISFTIINSIVYGDTVVKGDFQDEFVLDIDTLQPHFISPTFSVFKTKNLDLAQPTLKNVLNKNPLFKDYKKYRFDLDSNSSAIDIGTILNPPITTDFLGKPRDSKPDAGAFEWIK